MLLVDHGAVTDPRLNLAAEEYILRRLDPAEDYVFLYVNAPSVIVGRNQNTFAEVNAAFVRARGLPVLRRLSGGGTVYHDTGNLNVSVITRYAPENFQNFRKFTAPVIATLRALGVPAVFSGRSDIRVAGRKISGNAQYRSGARMLSHGTLLFNASLEDLEAALAVDSQLMTSRALKSVRSQVANVVEFLPAPLTLAEFKLYLLEELFGKGSSVPIRTLTPADWAAIQTLVATRYALWEWNYGASPPFTVHKRVSFAAGPVAVRLEVQQGRIIAAAFEGPGLPQAAALARQLIGMRYERESLEPQLTAERFEGLEGVQPAAVLELLGLG